jgi:hypothetical protein
MFSSLGGQLVTSSITSRHSLKITQKIPTCLSKHFFWVKFSDGVNFFGSKINDSLKKIVKICPKIVIVHIFVGFLYMVQVNSQKYEHIKKKSNF